jgi:hypothetical protein
MRTMSFRPLRVKSPSILMHDKTYLIRFKGTDLTSHVTIAASAEIHGEHLVLLRSDGRPAALFVMEIVESWSEFEL